MFVLEREQSLNGIDAIVSTRGVGRSTVSCKFVVFGSEIRSKLARCPSPLGDGVAINRGSPSQLVHPHAKVLFGDYS